ncbi:MAG: LysM peptidoglycan-binding domain-containing protein [Desulfococcaceae bacterium]
MRLFIFHAPVRLAMLWLCGVFLWTLAGCGSLQPAAPVQGASSPKSESLEPDSPDASAPIMQAAVSPSACSSPNADTARDPLAEPTESGEAGLVLEKAGIQAELDAALSLCREAQELWQEEKMESALKALDQAYIRIQAVSPEDDPDLLRQKEDIRFMISKRIMEIYASRNTMVQGKHRPIPMDMNAHVQTEIENLTRGNYFQRAYRRSGRYWEMIVAELEKAGLPTELAWLPLIESGFKVNAFSPARALGLWQFIPSTGYKFGLKRNRYIDERMDPEKSTRAAIAYLKELHNIFGDWSTVLAAYNCGEGRVLRIIRSQNVNYLDNFWDLYEQLPRETARYVPRFLATLHILQAPEKYNIDLEDREGPVASETLTVSRQVCLNRVAQEIGIVPEGLKALNPELRQTSLPPGHYALRVPAGKASVLLAKIDEIPVAQAAPPKRPAKKQTQVAYHRVKRGETLSTIADRYGVPLKSLMRANRLHRRHYIVAGKILKIPGVSGGSGPSKRKSHTVYVVQRGDSLWNIARKYGTSTTALGRLNNLSGSALSIGRVLKIPGRGAGNVNPGRLKTYNVRNGDVPIEIAQRHRMSLERFLQVNKMTKWSTIYPGQKVFVD